MATDLGFNTKKANYELSWHEQIIKATLEQWIDDLKKEVTQLQSRKPTQKLQVTFNP